MKARGRGLIVNIGSGIASAMPEAALLSGGWGGRAWLFAVTQMTVHCMHAWTPLFPLPDPPAYGAAKTYVDSLSRSLDAEAAPYGVRVQNLWPMFVCEWGAAVMRCGRQWQGVG